MYNVYTRGLYYYMYVCTEITVHTLLAICVYTTAEALWLFPGSEPPTCTVSDFVNKHDIVEQAQCTKHSTTPNSGQQKHYRNCPYVTRPIDRLSDKV